MIKRLELRATAGGVRVEASEGGWSRCYLLRPGEEMFLGAHTLAYVAGRLASCLCRDEGDDAGTLAGQRVRWVLTLSERHCSLYATLGDADLTLFWQDRDARLLATIELSARERARWCEELAGYP